MLKLKKVSLEPWEEAVGIFKDIEYDEYELSLRLGNYVIVFPAQSPEASILKTLGKRAVSKRIGVLRTDEPQKPLLFRKLNVRHQQRRTVEGMSVQRLRTRYSTSEASSI